ncbi:MAG TPA: hypothetical protein VM389_04515, partial [Phycisphaerae bacterium]|nr:hypothetical protein [Phycisphaerae bacterium]
MDERPDNTTASPFSEAVREAREAAVTPFERTLARARHGPRPVTPFEHALTRARQAPAPQPTPGPAGVFQGARAYTATQEETPYPAAMEPTIGAGEIGAPYDPRMRTQAESADLLMLPKAALVGTVDVAAGMVRGADVYLPDPRIADVEVPKFLRMGEERDASDPLGIRPGGPTGYDPLEIQKRVAIENLDQRSAFGYAQEAPDGAGTQMWRRAHAEFRHKQIAALIDYEYGMRARVQTADSAVSWLRDLAPDQMRKEVAAAANGPMFEWSPAMANRWAAVVGQQIPVFAANYAATAAGGAAGAAVGGPVGAKIGGHAAGFGVMALLEAGDFYDAGKAIGLDREINKKYARAYGIGSGAIEHVQNLWMGKAFTGKAVTGPAAKMAIAMLKELAGITWEGAEELSQNLLQNWLLQKAVAEHNELHPKNPVKAPTLGEGGLRAFVTGAVVAGVFRGAGQGTKQVFGGEAQGATEAPPVPLEAGEGVQAAPPGGVRAIQAGPALGGGQVQAERVTTEAAPRQPVQAPQEQAQAEPVQAVEQPAPAAAKEPESTVQAEPDWVTVVDSPTGSRSETSVADLSESLRNGEHGQPASRQDSGNFPYTVYNLQAQDGGQLEVRLYDNGDIVTYRDGKRASFGRQRDQQWHIWSESAPAPQAEQPAAAPAAAALAKMEAPPAAEAEPTDIAGVKFATVQPGQEILSDYAVSARQRGGQLDYKDITSSYHVATSKKVSAQQVVDYLEGRGIEVTGQPAAKPEGEAAPRPLREMKFIEVRAEAKRLGVPATGKRAAIEKRILAAREGTYKPAADESLAEQKLQRQANEERSQLEEEIVDYWR